jgi:hypothetical protein
MVMTGACESILGGVAVLAARHAEGADLRVPEIELPDFLEELDVLRIGKGIAPFDVIDAELVESAGDGELVLEGEVDALPLAAVAERGVVDLDACHRRSLADSRSNEKSPGGRPGLWRSFVREPWISRRNSVDDRNDRANGRIQDRDVHSRDLRRNRR